MVRSSGFGAALQRYRRAAGLTQEELAERAGISPRAISALERGVNQAPRKTTLAAIIGALPLSHQERVALDAAARGSVHPPGQPPAAMPLPDAGAIPASTEPAFVGRAAELRLLERHVLGDGPPVALVVGEPGIGKSRLLREVGSRATLHGLRVVEGRGQRQSGQDPYIPLLDAVAGCIERLTSRERTEHLAEACWLARMLPELAHSGVIAAPPTALAPAQERRLVFQAVARLFTGVAARQGLVVLLDDVQWASQDALDLLVSLALASVGTRVRIVAAYRGTELAGGAPLAGTLADLANNGLATRVMLGPLVPREAGELLAALLEESGDGGRVVSLMRRTGGVPFFLVHCAREAAHDEASRGGPEAVPWSVTQSIRQRVARLPAVAAEVLRGMALAGTECSLALLYALGKRLHLTEDDVRRGIDAACEAGLLVEPRAQAYQFAHDLIREAVEADIGPAASVALHRWIAEALETVGDDASTGAVAFQYIRGEQWERAARHLERAADRALDARALVEAVDLYAELAAGVDGLGRTRWAAAVREKLAAVLMHLARYDEALDVLRLALASYRAQQDMAGVVRAVARAGEVHVLRGTPREGLALLEAELPATLEATTEAPGETHMPSAELAPAYVAQAWLLNACGRYAEALPIATRAARLARARQDQAGTIRADLRRSQLLLMLGKLDEGAAVLREVIPLAEAAGDPWSLRLALNSLGWVHEARGEFARDEEYTDRALAVARQLGDPTVLAFMTSNLGGPAFNLGRWRQAREAFEAGLALMRPLGPTWASAWPPLLLGRLDLAEGRWRQAEGLLAEAAELAMRSGDLQALRWAHAALAERDLLDGAPAAARDRLTPLLDRLDQQESDVCPLLPLVAWANLELGEMARAEALVADAIARANSSGMRPTLMSAWRVRSLVWQRRERWDQAKADLAMALEESRRIRNDYGQGVLLYEQGRLAQRMGHADGALRHLRSAGRVLASLGERLYGERVDALAAELATAVRARQAGTTPRTVKRARSG